MTPNQHLSKSAHSFVGNAWWQFRAVDYCCNILPFSCAELGRINRHRHSLLTHRLLIVFSRTLPENRKLITEYLSDFPGSRTARASRLAPHRTAC